MSRHVPTPAILAAILLALVAAVVLLTAGPAQAATQPNLCAPTAPAGLTGTGCRRLTARPALSVGGVIKTVKSAAGSVAGGVIGAGAGVVAGAGLAAIGSWITAGAVGALKATASVIGNSTQPRLGSTWFSAAYWRVAGVAALLTVPFLFAAAIQALLRADMAMLARAAFAYLPAGMLAVAIAGPVTMLLLKASDEMSSIVSSASGEAGASFFGHLSQLAGDVSSVSGSPFVAVVVGVLTVGAALALWLELLVRESAVYVIVLMLPLFFAALVWPARRVWAVRAVELLIALILSKFTIVAVLALGGAALAHAGSAGPAAALAGVTLVLLAVLTPWATLRLLPLQEIAAAAAGSLRPFQVEHVLRAAEAATGRHSTAVPDSSPGLPETGLGGGRSAGGGEEVGPTSANAPSSGGAGPEPLALPPGDTGPELPVAPADSGSSNGAGDGVAPPTDPRGGAGQAAETVDGASSFEDVGDSATRSADAAPAHPEHPALAGMGLDGVEYLDLDLAESGATALPVDLPEAQPTAGGVEPTVELTSPSAATMEPELPPTHETSL